MSDLRTILERGVGDATPPPDGFERMLHRRDRKRRNQRIVAGVVGIAVFVAAVWIVTSVGSLDRSESSVVPGGDVTGPLETGPAETAEDAWDGRGLPPQGTAPSTPVEGEVIARGGADRFRVLVYADGRVLWGTHTFAPVTILERRLSAAALELVQSGDIKMKDLRPPWVLHGIPTSAWVDAGKPYVASRYAVCFSGGRGNGGVDPATVTSMLPAPAEDLLRDRDPDPLRSECLVVTTQEARALDEILREAGLVPGPPALSSAAAWSTRDDVGERVRISITPLLPDGLSY